MNKATLKSMASLAFYLLILVAMWAVIGVIAFPGEDDEDIYSKLVAENHALLTQVAENAIDPEKWAGITGMPEVNALLKELGVTDVRSVSGKAIFTIPCNSADRQLCLEYIPGGIQYPDAKAEFIRMGHSPDSWIRTDAPDGMERWEGGPFGKGYLNYRELSHGFWLVDRYIPT